MRGLWLLSFGAVVASCFIAGILMLGCGMYGVVMCLFVVGSGCCLGVSVLVCLFCFERSDFGVDWSVYFAV